MRFSKTFIKTLREAPKDETAKNGAFLTRAGYIHKEMAGVYDYLPLGLRVIENIKRIIREELNKLGCEEVQMSALQNPEPWEMTGRFSDQEVDIWFKTELASGGVLGLAPTHEEPITSMLKSYISSYRDLPLYVYQFQTKFRNELRAKSGILRGREFLMKDLYSFHTSEEDLDKFYAEVEQAYGRIFARLGIGDDTFETFASGGIFARYSHEFQTILPVGEDTVYYNADKSTVLNKEVFNDEVLSDLGVKGQKFEETTAAEVGNIFKLKFKYSEPLELKYIDEKNKQQTVYMGCYGIGVSRLMGVVAEKFADEKGLVWPEEVAPYKYYLVGIGENGVAEAEKFYRGREDQVLFDNRNVRPGEKFADADLIGLPYRIIISDKTLANGAAELVDRFSGESQMIELANLNKL
ncbi:MAG: His/Gly/Thr/Pro-type tRNA ligase C-terminal domain-containing protein [Candidatus Saccharibacteria bacterium]|uniref:Proline--tRNA ligase n=1 Tax=Candidatus Nanosyncoccus alces TaxID=2171997 RepID=A0ABY0FML8_9BACT|nr:aminoacyl--tRNA ligase-related protein [Candidatus Nanosyncoccus alces]MDO4399284.1 His/Gly/Thr/Pro-type tRNA ligase C-terminal domain-containing protein [Candidatus Saccharibacteria bacterium]RYC74529.1 Proline--tRNA ligase [Candidatus Nanosyncoccus alces]